MCPSATDPSGSTAAAEAGAMRSRLVRFAAYGALGLATEIVFTGLKDLARSGGRGFRGHTGPRMFPVSGLAPPPFEPAHDALRGRAPAPVRAVVYAAGFTAVEYASGRGVRLGLGRAPWGDSPA